MSRGICCHVGGQIDFDGEGNLYLSTGDDTNPFQSAGYAPLDDRETRNPAFDARRSAGNTNDLRGKLLRIRVRANGGYTVPTGNLFRQGQARTRPEIYAMGFRNPFRFAVNRTNGDVYVGDYSPDAQVANPELGPEGIGRWMIVRRPVNFGWPFCITPDRPYVDHDFTPNAPQWRRVQLQRADQRLAQQHGPAHPAGGRLAGRLVLVQHHAGPVPGAVQPGGLTCGQRHRADGRSGDAVRPGDQLGVPVAARVLGPPALLRVDADYAKVFELNRPNGNQLGAIHDLLGIESDGPANQSPNIVLDNPMDMEFGPDNALYTLEYGTGYFAELPAAQLARIDYVRDGQYTPVVRASATPSTGTDAPLTVQFSSAGTEDANGDNLSYQWGLDSNGTVDSSVANPTHTYTARGVYEATLRVTDQTGRSASWQVRVTVGNQAPVVRLTAVSTSPPFNFGDTVHFEVTVTDDQPVDCARVSVAYILGDESHGHPQTSTAGCSGDISVPIHEAHAGAANISAVFVATYTDNPGWR